MDSRRYPVSPSHIELKEQGMVQAWETALRGQVSQSKRMSGTGAFIDRWIFVFMAGFYVTITLVGFIPDSFLKIAAVEAGERPKFPLILHAHALLTGSFMALLLAQTWLAATGRYRYHQQLGMICFALVPAIILVGFLLVPAMADQLMQQLAIAPADKRASIEALMLRRETVLLGQFRTGILFPLFIAIALWNRRRDSSLHKRMMILATTVVLPPSINRMLWLPNSFPESFWATELYLLLAISPMFIWDIVRQRCVHKAYFLWALCMLPVATVTNLLWNTPYWHEIAAKILWT